jgi:hypothetical protein
MIVQSPLRLILAEITPDQNHDFGKQMVKVAKMREIAALALPSPQAILEGSRYRLRRHRKRQE